jgi:hypothetical protein
MVEMLNSIRVRKKFASLISQAKTEQPRSEVEATVSDRRFYNPVKSWRLQEYLYQATRVFS